METLSDRLGLSGRVVVALRATPPYAIPGLVFTYFQFAGLLERSANIAEFQDNHIHLKDTSWLYYAFRPQGREAIRIMRKDYGLD